MMLFLIHSSLHYLNSVTRLRDHACDFTWEISFLTWKTMSIPTVSQNFLGSRPWFAGDSLTFPDFIMYELLDQHRELDSALCQKYTKLMEFLDRFGKLPKIEAYMKSPR